MQFLWKASSDALTLLIYQNENIDNPKGSVSYNYFSTVGEKAQAKIKYSHKIYTNYLKNESPCSGFFDQLQRRN